MQKDNEHECIKLVSNNAYTFYWFDHLFHYTWLIFKGNEYDVYGALKKGQISVAYLAAKNTLSLAIRIYVYTHGETPYRMECFLMQQLKRLLQDDLELYNTIENIYYSCADDRRHILSEIEQIERLYTQVLITEDVWEFIGKGKQLHFKNHVMAANEIDKLFHTINDHRYERLAYPEEITQLIRDIGNSVKKGR